MAEESDFSTSAQPTLQDLATFLADELFDVHRIARLEKAVRNAHAEGATVAHAAQTAGAQDFLGSLQDVGDEAIQQARKALAWGLAHLVAHLLGVEVPPEAFSAPARAGADSLVGRALGETFLGVLRPEGAELAPNDDTAVKLIGVLTQFALNTWFEGTILEEAFSWIPLVGHADEIGKLGQQLVQATGLDELGRLAFRPLGNVTVVTPMTWQANKTYRPNLLPEAEILKAFIRGDYTDAEAREEFARLGYSDRRQDMLLKSAQKYLSLDDSLLLQRHGNLTADDVFERLRLQGHDEIEARFEIAAAELKRLLTFYDNAVSGLQRAFVNRDIDEHTFATLIPPELYTDAERELLVTQARLLQSVNVRYLSEGDVVRAVKESIVPMAYYRDWMTREGYPEPEQVIKELLLRSEIDKEFKAADARKQVEADRAAAAAKKAADAEARKQQVEQDRALARRGPVSELSRAAVRGLIPISRVVEVLSAQYDADTVNVFVADIEQQHADYLAQQQAAEDARKRAAVRHVDVGALEQAVLAGVLTLDQFRQSLSGQQFAPADVALLTATLAVRKQDQDVAKAKRAAAEKTAAQKHIDLKKFEALVRRGYHTIADYQALLDSLNFDDAAIADMTQLLQLEMVDDANAAKTRADAAAKAAAKGLSLDQIRRAVLIGVSTVDDFDHVLADTGYTVDARAVLVAELQHDLDEANAARQRRAAADATTDPRMLPLATIARAARLGIIPIDVYRQRLEEAGYSDDDIAIEMDLLVQEIADVQAARQLQQSADATPAPSGLTLAQLAAAVKAGVRSLDDYRAAAITKGLNPDDVLTLVRVLGDELATTTAAKARRAAIGSTVQPGQVSISVLADEVRAGTRSVASYGAALMAAGLDPVDVDLLVALLGDELAGGTSG